MTIEVGSTFTDPGATALDVGDGDLTSSIVVTGSVDTSTIGTYTLTYNVSDTSGNAADPVTRTVNVVDTTAPVITLLGDNPMTIEVGSTFTDPGATASDAGDGDLTSSIVVTGSVDTSTLGTYTLTYNVSDASGNVADPVTRTVNVVDTTAPVITLLGDNPMTIEVGSTFTDPGATALDAGDGDLTSSIVVSGSVDTSTIGTYTLTYDVSDASGNAADPVTRTVNVVDTTVPVITLLGDTTVTIEVGTTYTDSGATAADNYDGDLTSSIAIVNNVDTSTVGTYTVTYNVSDTSGNAADSVTRTVNVVDTTAPVITLLGDNPMTIEVGTTFTDPGATASDAGDGDLTSSIVVSGSVDTSTIGTYTLTYDVSDTSGNPADSVTRTVNVVDTTVPVITLLGDTTVTIEVGATYTDSGATAADNYDGDLTSSIAIVNNVDTSTVGTYTVTYDVSDASGNAADPVTRTVNVVDTTVPVITLLGDTTVTIEVGATYTDSGATAADNYDGDLTSSIAIVNNVDTSTVGTYTVTYNVSDASGNAAVPVTRTVNVVDTTVPVITLLGDTTVTIEVGTTYTDSGATAADNYDGDLTSSIAIVNNVDTSTVGTYTVTYNVSDTSGNAADSVTRTVNVVDTTAPVITLLGDNPMTIEVGTTFTDPGATASDAGDGDLTSSIVVSGSVDTSTIGTYTLTYDVSDTSGNAADSVTRTVNVVDTTAPVITLLGDNLMTIEVGTTFTDPGAVATDNYDGDLTSSIVVSGSVDTSTIGTYTLTYNVSDASGNAAVPVTRTVNVVDTTVPVITLLGDTTVTIEVGATYTDSGATAADNYDGDLTSSIAIVNNVDTSTVGTYTVTYNVSDTSGNAADSVTRTVNVVDTTVPVITLLGDTTVTIEVGATYTDSGATAADNYDGDLTSSIAIVNNVDTSTVGTYTVTYNVSDTSGNAAVPVTRTVNVVDTTAPVITLLGDNPMTIEVGSTFTDPGATASDAGDGDLTSSIVVTGSVDTSTLGTYTLTYNVSDASGNVADPVTRTVNVVDTTAPVITLLGDNPMTIEVGSTFTDPGATALDAGDGDLTSSIVVSGSVDTSTIGTYTLTYDVSDASGNAADPVTRTVNVVDTTVPVITLLGDTTVTIEVGTTYTDSGATAADNYDGDLTSSIAIVNNVDTSTVGTYTVTYNVSDTSGNAADSVTRTVNVVDTTAPVITLLGDNPMTIEVGTTFTDPGATASDAGDGDLTSSIVVSGSVDTSTIGTYTLTYDVSDTSGNPADSVTRTVNVVDTTVPVITLLGDTTVTIEVGATYTDSGATAADNYDGDLTSSIAIVNNVDTSTVGTYTVTYDVSDASGNAADPVTRTVNVVDTTVPVITLLGDTTVTIEVGATYTDSGATAADNYDGDLTSSIAIVNNVDTSTVGTYTVTYNVSDASGNAAVPVTRTVNVVDTTVPVITLLGDTTVTIEVGTTYTDSGATAADNYDGDLTSSIAIVNNVDTSTVGTYTVTYNVSDTSGNAADSVTRTVNVVDTTAPVITLLGDNPMTIEVGTTFTDPGATASDAGDGDLTSSIVVSGSVDTSTIGTYTLTYDVSDTSGNAADSVTRTVNVVDTTAPVITLLGDNLMTIEVGTTFTDPGAVATDNYDGDLTSSIVVSGSVDTSTIGTYTLTYNVSDASGNAAVPVTRTVNVVDTTVPVITLLGDTTVTIEVGATYTDSGATAADNYDGDLTSSIAIVNNVDTSTVGTYTVTYNVSDTSGNAADSVTRTVNVVDTTVPVITLLGDTTVTIEVGATYTDSGATAADNYDGDLTSSIAIVNNVDTSTVGTYTVTYNVSDTSGNAAVPVTRTVNVVDTTAPVITLLGDNPMTIEVGSTFTDPGATASDAGDGDLTSSIVVTGSVDTSTLGTYTLTYNVSDASGNVADPVTRTVNVVDTTAPVITLLGDNPMTIEVGSTFTDPGATALDAGDGDLTSSIVVSGSVDTSTIGTYTLTYDVSDASGNAADPVTRTVNVVDTTVPVITLLGDTTVTIEVGTTYTDSGATAADNYDGDLTSSIAIVNNVDTSTVGTYTVTYNVSDTSGNAADSVTRTVNVVDTTAPVITLLGDNPMTIEVGTTFTDPGATASDAGDGDLTSSIVVSGSVDTSTIGTYTLTYDVSDTSGNPADSVTRTVNVVDTTVPVITLLGDTTVTIEVGATYTDSGATAADNYDGDLTSSIAIVNNVDTSTVGTYTVTYDVSDASGNAADPVTRTVNVVDTTVPVITLLGDTTVTIEVGATYTDSGATAADNYDGDLTSSIAIVNNVDTSTVETYTVTYNVSDTSGNAAVPVTRTVNVVDTTVPVITLLGDTTVTIEVGATYTDSGATAADNYDGDLTSSIAIVNNVDTSTVGTYTVTYNVSDTTGNAADSVTRTVNVVDTTVPVITLLGDTTVTIEVGATYTDSGATAADNYDGDLTSSIAIVNNVDTSTVGTYTVTYNVSDTSGNAAVPVTRTVNVVDTTAPVITLLGDNPMTIEVGTTFTDPGATASDAGDGDLTSSIVVSGSVDTSTIGTYRLTYDVSDTSGNAAVPVTRKVNVVNTLGTETIEDDFLEIYPIPSQTFLIIRQNTHIKKVKLYNIIGQIIYEDFSNSKEIRINTSSFKSGIYLMRINDNKKLVKIIKQ